MADRDNLVVIASDLRPEQAGMLRELLESAGIVAAVWDDVLTSMEGYSALPGLFTLGGGAKLAVRAADAERAREIVRSAGVLPGLEPTEPVEIPDSEWARDETTAGLPAPAPTPAGPPPRHDAARPPPAGRGRPMVRSGSRWGLRAVFAALVLAAVFVLLWCAAG